MFFFPLGELFLFFQVPAWQGKFIEVSVLPTSRREHLTKSRRMDSILFRGYCELHIVGGPGKPPCPHLLITTPSWSFSPLRARPLLVSTLGPTSSA